MMLRVSAKLVLDRQLELEFTFLSEQLLESILGLWPCPYYFLPNGRYISCPLSLLLCRTCKSLPICRKCLSLFIHLCWRRALLFGGEDSLPFFLSRMLIPGLNVVVDPLCCNCGSRSHWACMWESKRARLYKPSSQH